MNEATSGSSFVPCCYPRKCTTGGAWHNTHFPSPSSGGWKSAVKVSAHWFLLEALRQNPPCGPLQLLGTTHNPQCVLIYRHALRPRSPLSWWLLRRLFCLTRTRVIGSRPALTQLGPVLPGRHLQRLYFRCDHILRFPVDTNLEGTLLNALRGHQQVGRLGGLRAGGHKLASTAHVPQSLCRLQN